MTDSNHPRDRFLTIFGRKPVEEALLNPALDFGQLRLDRNAKGDNIQSIIKHAKRRRVDLKRVSSREVNRISKNARQDQGVVLDVAAQNMKPLDAWLSDLTGPASLIVLDGVTTPANVGITIRSCAAAGIEGLVIPRQGCPDVGPMVIKASAGTAFQAPILKATTAVDAIQALKRSGFTIFGLIGESDQSLFDISLPTRSAWVLGNETLGVSDSVRNLIDVGIRIPMQPGIESLNVAAAATVVAYELRRHQISKVAPTGA